MKFHAKFWVPGLKNDWVMANIWKFGLVWLDLVWFGFEWYGIWVMSRCSYMQNLELLAWKMAELGAFNWIESGKIAVVVVGFIRTMAL